MPPVLPPYTKPISAMNKRELIELCDRFDQPTHGIVSQLRTRMNTYLRNHREDLENNPQFARLYPRRRGRVPQNQQNPDVNEDDADPQLTEPSSRQTTPQSIPDRNHSAEPSMVPDPSPTPSRNSTPAPNTINDPQSIHSSSSVSERFEPIVTADNTSIKHNGMLSSDTTSLKHLSSKPPFVKFSTQNYIFY